MSLEGAPPKAWGAPLERLDQLWTRLETRLAVWVILAEMLALCLWLATKSLGAVYTPGGSAVGLSFRLCLGVVAGGLIGHFSLRPKAGVAPGLAYRLAVGGGMAGGGLLAWLLVGLGAGFFGNLGAWLQNASALALVGGPRGLVTRLTLWLALLGASLAASSGKHINIDVATRFLPARLGLPVAVVGWLAAALVCFAAAYGFVDSIAVTKYRAEAFRPCPPGQGAEGQLCESRFAERMAAVREGAGADLFLLGRQLSLDLRTLPRVLAGEPYDRWLRPAEWNAWVRDADWRAHFSREAVDSLIMPSDDPDSTKIPLVTAPDTGEGRDLLIRDLNFILPFGLLMVALKMLLRVLRALAGHVHFDPDAAHAAQGKSAEAAS